MFLKINVDIKESSYSTKKVHFVDTLQDEHIFGIPQSHVDHKLAIMS